MRASPRLRKFVVSTGAVFILVVLIALAAIELRWKRTFDAPYPALHASADPDVIARGRYLAYGPANCSYCHVPRSQWSRLDAGDMPPLAGGHEFPLPFARVFSANLTPDAETGIGRRTDGELARVLRYNVRPDGRAAMPLMEFQQMSDEDLTAVISFLRVQPPVRNAVAEHDVNLLGRILLGFSITPAAPTAMPLRTSPPSEPTVERGRYLANDVALCVTCHTDRNRMDGSYVGPSFAGGQQMDSAAHPDRVFVPPNLTPDPSTGVMIHWTEAQFIKRFRLGAMVEGTLMPWGAYSRLGDNDLQAIFRYLHSLPPVHNDTGPVVRNKR